MKLEPTTILAIMAVIQAYNGMMIGLECRRKKWFWMGLWSFFAGAYTTVMIVNICKILAN